MSNFKLVKTAAALALGASVVTSAVATTDASAASKYKIKSGKLYVAKTGKLSKGYVTYKSIVYKNGKKLTGLKGKTYYKAGKKATGTYKGAYYVKGVKKVTTGTYNKAYYVKGVKKVSTGLYASKYYKDGKLATGTYKGAYYVKGLKKVTTGTYNGAYYVNGVKKVSTGLLDGKLYVDGKLNKGYKLYKEDLYKDAVLNKELALFEGKLYDGAKLNEGHKIFKDELYKGSELNKEVVLFEGKLYDGAKLNEGIKKFEDKWYNNAELADGTFTVEGVEKAFENGVEVGAKVKSVEAINATQVLVTFNKTVEKDSVINATDKKVKNVTFKSLDDKVITSSEATGELSKDGKKLTITAKANETFEGRYDVTIDKVKDVDGKDLPKYEAKNLDFGKDTTAPALVGTEKVNSTKVKVNFSEPLASEGNWTFTDANGKAVAATKDLSSDGLSVEVTITDANLKAGSEVTATILGAKDKAGNVINPNPSTVKFVKGDKDGVAPVVSSVTAKGLDTFEVKLSEAVQSLAIDNIFIDGTTLVGTVTPDAEDNTKYTIKATTALTAGLHKVEVKSILGKEVSDLSGEPLTAFTQLVDFKADTVKPAFVSSSVVVNADTKKEQLVLNFDKEVTDTELTNVVATKLDKDLVTTKGKLTAGTLIANPKNKKQLVVDLDTVKFTPDAGGSSAEALTKDATYTLNFADGAVNDTNTVANTSKAFEVKFKRGEDGTAVTTNKPEVTAVTATDSNTVTVTFDKAVDGVSATNVANYSIPGLTIEKAVLNPVSGTTQSVTLTLKKGTNTLDGDRVLTISNVKAKNGEVMNTVSKTVENMLENVAPTVTKAQFTNTAEGNVTEITLSFSEVVKASTADLNIFQVFVGDSATPETTSTNVDLSNNPTKEIKLTVNLTPEQIAKGVTVKLNAAPTTATTKVTDVNHNVLDFTSIKVVQ